MKPTLSSRGAALISLLFAALPLVTACGPETPPYNELPLRDALRASPESLAALPEEARSDLARRFADEHSAAEIEATPAHADVPSALALVRGADEAREAEGRDAVVLGSIEPEGDGFVVQALALAGAPAAVIDPASLELPAEEPTKALEEAALRGQAGAVLAEIARRAEAEDLVRVTGWPAGVMVAERTVYVNASWLVAMSALEPSEAPAPVLAPALPAGPRGLSPQSIDGNPYDLPLSIEACASGVRDKCACAASSQCIHEPADTTFDDANAECTWVNQEPVNAEALCVLAIMSVFNVAACVEKGSSSCTTPPVTDRQQALDLLLNTECRAHLDACLETGKPADSSSGGGSSGGGSCNRGCNNGSCSSCDSPDCNNSSCNNSSCSNSNCGGSNCGGSNCGGGNCGGGSCGKGCRVARVERDAPPSKGSWGDALLFLAPAAYMARRTRRRS
jgi:hypothetical protein